MMFFKKKIIEFAETLASCRPSPGTPQADVRAKKTETLDKALAHSQDLYTLACGGRAFWKYPKDNNRKRVPEAAADSNASYVSSI